MKIMLRSLISHMQIDQHLLKTLLTREELFPATPSKMARPYKSISEQGHVPCR